MKNLQNLRDEISYLLGSESQIDQDTIKNFGLNNIGSLVAINNFNTIAGKIEQLNKYVTDIIGWNDGKYSTEFEIKMEAMTNFINSARVSNITELKKEFDGEETPNDLNNFQSEWEKLNGELKENKLVDYDAAIERIEEQVDEELNNLNYKINRVMENITDSRRIAEEILENSFDMEVELFDQTLYRKKELQL